ncbi:beta-ketoacyl synthase N-terminal-like domain-containing protein [Aquimarina algiphila]|uniref:beta-ketoacyl synthase N-terminal-like domain-containing protein n=1 Tax=Aquimarina algiphila TaxID=2047982 RepID=UPI00248F6D20|nr:beta-ketoacyl synthase N-terminal-like domain-containing protein [Aquimarina algiphila]
MTANNNLEGKIAIIGMSGKFPGASDVFSFWNNLLENLEGISHFSKEQIASHFNIKKENISKDLITSFGVLGEETSFDADFFKFSDNEAVITSPQQRLFLTCAYEALEQGGVMIEDFNGLIGIYAGSSETDYLRTLEENKEVRSKTTSWQLRLANGIDFLSSRVAYKLGLRGPAITVQTACSTSLVAVHQACNSLLLGDCDIALAGGSSVHASPIFSEYMEGGVLSQDGKCRAFDQKANGTVASNGVGVVVLKRLEEAVLNKDNIIAVIRGTSVNNDGNLKIGFTAPSIQGQVDVFNTALEISDTIPGDVQYIETHGTATELGDPIEVTALNKVYNSLTTNHKDKCWIGSVKSNIGHTDAAAGICGLIKTSLTVSNGIIPASLHFNTPNSKIDFTNSRLEVVSENKNWKSNRRVAAVSSLGIGGTNAHAILENFVKEKQEIYVNKKFVFPISAKTTNALSKLINKYSKFDYKDIYLEEVAWTMQTGRSPLPYKTYVVASSFKELINELHIKSQFDFGQIPLTTNKDSFVFVFSGQGGQYNQMGKQLYDQEPVFKGFLDECFDIFESFGIPLKTILFWEEGDQIHEMTYAQAAIFSIEYALSQYYMTLLELKPAMVLGHSLGAYAAAVVSGIFSLETAIKIIVKRSGILERIDQGAMIAVLGEVSEDIERYGVSIAARNSSNQTVLSGKKKDLETYITKLEAQNIEYRWLHIKSAAHSHLLDPFLKDFSEYMHTLQFFPPKITMISDHYGRALEANEAINPQYWVDHLRNTIDFKKCCDFILKKGDYSFLELGPGQTLSTLINQNSYFEESKIFGSIPHIKDEVSEYIGFLESIGELWKAGVTVRWKFFYSLEKPWRVALPGYAFDNKNYSVTDTHLDSDKNKIEKLSSKPHPIKPGNEEQIRKQIELLFIRILGNKEIKGDSNFFNNGGDSLMALKLFKEVKSTFAVKLSVREIFKTPTPSALASKIINLIDKKH